MLGLGLFRFWADRLTCSRLPIFRFLLLQQLVDRVILREDIGEAVACGARNDGVGAEKALLGK